MKHFLKPNNYGWSMVLFDFFKALLVYLIATSFALSLVETGVINDNIFGIYMLGVAVISLITNGYVWGILASVMGVIAVNFFFTYPYFALNFTITGYPMTFALLLLMSVMVSALTAKVKKAAVRSSIEKKRAEILNEMSKAILTAGSLDSILDAAASYFCTANQCSVVLYMGSPMEPEKMVVKTEEEEERLIFRSMLERQVAEKAFQKGEPMGADIDPKDQNCKGTYIPIMTEQHIYGVLGFLFDDARTVFDETYNLINVMISQTILALERQELDEKARSIQLEKEKEKMRSNLLRAVSHDLRTPLTGILGSTATLMENSGRLSEKASRKLLQDIYQDADWLIHMVENLLSVTKISGNDTKLKKQTEIVEEVVSEAVTRVRKRFPNVSVEVRVPDEVLLVPMDATLIEQVLINLIENAIRHSGSSDPISLSVFVEGENAAFRVSDNGKGIAPEKLPEIFDGKSSAASSDSTRGIGIGLSICKSIIVAHEGKIYAENNQNGGASFTFVLPMKGDI